MSSNKREPTKYNIFVKEQIPLIKKEFPQLSRQDLMRKVGELWKNKNSSTYPKRSSSPISPKSVREPTKYNIFVKDRIRRVFHVS